MEEAAAAVKVTVKATMAFKTAWGTGWVTEALRTRPALRAVAELPWMDQTGIKAPHPVETRRRLPKERLAIPRAVAILLL